MSDLQPIGEFKFEEVDEGNACECGRPTFTHRVTVGQVVILNHPHKLCDLCAEKKVKTIEEEQHHRDRIALQSQLTSDSHHDERNADASFETFEKTAQNSAARGVAEKWCKLEERRPNLVIHGPVGCGKTFLARCVYREIVGATPSQWLNVAALIDEARVGFNDREAAWRAQRMRQAARAAPVLFLDDLGKNKPGEGGWLEELLYSIVDPRYRRELPTIVTTEFFGPELSDRVGKAVVSRLAHGAWKAGIKEPEKPYRSTA